MERRLAAILAADVVGYTRLMGADETGTLRRLTELRQQVLEPLIAEHNGRIVKLIGDGLLVEFVSVVDALTCAVAWQTAVMEREGEVDEDKRLKFRIGINLGDVIVEGSDIHGDGVNVAARLEGLADPGGICLSSDAYRQAKGKVEVGFEDLGEHQLKNVTEPIQIYRVIADASPSSFGSASSEAPSPSDKPSIAVLPFTNMSDDPEQEYFSDGITEDIITELGRFRELFVIARTSSFSYKGKSIRVQDIGRDLGVAYVVEGSVRKAGNRVRVTVQLVDAESGNRIWAERYDRELEDIFAVQDELTGAIVTALPGRLHGAVLDRARRRPTKNLAAYQHWLRGRRLWWRWTRESNEQAAQHYARATELDPSYAVAYAYFAWCYVAPFEENWSADGDGCLQRAVELAEKALALDDGDSDIHQVCGYCCLLSRRYGEARNHFDHAVKLNPNQALNYTAYGYMLAMEGDAEEAVRISERGRELNPLSPDMNNWTLAVAYFTARRYEDALNAALQVNKGVGEIHLWIAACCAWLSRTVEAKAELAEFQRIAKRDWAAFPGGEVEAWHTFWRRLPYKDREDLEHLIEGARRAGLPDELCLSGV